MEQVVLNLRDVVLVRWHDIDKEKNKETYETIGMVVSVTQEELALSQTIDTKDGFPYCIIEITLKDIEQLIKF